MAEPVRHKTSCGPVLRHRVMVITPGAAAPCAPYFTSLIRASIASNEPFLMAITPFGSIR